MILAAEKAKQLYNNYEQIFINAYADSWGDEAKQSSLIAVKEIISTLNHDIRDLDVRGNILINLIEYWRDVKTEIEKL